MAASSRWACLTNPPVFDPRYRHCYSLYNPALDREWLALLLGSVRGVCWFRLEVPARRGNSFQVASRALGVVRHERGSSIVYQRYYARAGATADCVGCLWVCAPFLRRGMRNPTQERGPGSLAASAHRGNVATSRRFKSQELEGGRRRRLSFSERGDWITLGLLAKSYSRSTPLEFVQWFSLPRRPLCQ